MSILNIRAWAGTRTTAHPAREAAVIPTDGSPDMRMCSAGEWRRFLTSVLLLVILGASASHAQVAERKGKVTYVTSSTVYVDLGMRDGFREGDTLRIRKGRTVIAALRVTNISSKSMATSILEKTGTILAGEEVVGIPHEIELPKPTRATIDSMQTVVTRPEQQPKISRSSHEEAITNGTRIRGRMSMQYYALESSVSPGLDFSQPAAVINLTAERLFGAPLEFRYYSNHRFDARSETRRSGVADDRLRNRFYQASLQYGDRSAPFSAILGRFVPYEIGGIGTVDGAMVVGRSNGLEAGIVAGSQPGYRNSELNFRDQKIAAYIGRNEAASPWKGSVAYAQTYRDGALDRGYFYLVNSWYAGSEITLYQNASVDMYDTDGRDGVFDPHLTDLYLSASWRPLRTLSFTGSFADRRNIFFLRSFAELPDSAFGTGRLRNYQLSTGVNIPGGMYASVTASLRTSANTDPAASLSGRYTWSNALDSRMNFYLLGGYADNVYTTSTSWGAEVNRDLFEGMYTAFRIIRSDYTPVAAGRDYSRTSLTLDMYYRLSRAWYLSLSAEHYLEGDVTTERVYTEISMRLD